jgi:hypothetical protein
MKRPKNPEADTIPVVSLNREKSIKEVCDMIALKESKLSDMLMVAWRYAEHFEPQDSR